MFSIYQLEIEKTNIPFLVWAQVRIKMWKARKRRNH